MTRRDETGLMGGGFGRFFIVNQISSKTQKELLKRQKETLQNRLEVIDMQLVNL